MKGTGKNPVELAPVVQPTLDLSALYAWPQVERVTDTLAAAQTVGTGLAITVPAGESWRVFACAGGFGGGAHTVGDVLFGRLQLSGVQVLTPPPFTVLAVDDNPRFGLCLPSPVLLAAGEAISFALNHTLTGTTTLRVDALIARLVT